MTPRRSFLSVMLLSAVAACTVTSCSPPREEVILYCSADADFVRPIIEEFTRRTGITVRLVGDTEATKTTGLVQRLLAEREHPRADVWWSSELLGTLELARAGALQPGTTLRDDGQPWTPPESLRAPDGSWYGFAPRTRMVIWSTTRLAGAKPPRSLADLTDPRFRARIGIARPEFGTTRGHIAELAALHGEEALEAYFTALRANGLKLYDGNMAVVRAIDRGEIDVGLTDSDDAWAGQRNGWSVEAVPVLSALSASQTGAITFIPNTAGLVRSGPHPESGRRLLEYILSADVERALARSESRNIPTRPAVAAEFPELTGLPPGPAIPADRLLTSVEPALRAARKAFAGL